jgi:carbamate kinase
MLVVAALGGNALLRKGEAPEAEIQQRHVASAVAALVPIAREHALVVTHGNGPQVGLLALQCQAYAEVHPYPLDVLGAETEGMIGYWIEQELRGRLPEREVATLLTQIEVDPADPAFGRPDKPIGPRFDRERASRLESELGWYVAPDGDSELWRRVVPSPEPGRMLELSSLRLLVGAGTIVVCAGGGGVPVTVDPDGSVRGVEAVIDKDLASARLATQLAADALLLLTDVDAVYAGWGSSAARALRRTSPSELRRQRFEPGSMGPKVEGACRFVAATGRFAGIGSLEQAAGILSGAAGTSVGEPPGHARADSASAPG